LEHLAQVTPAGAERSHRGEPAATCSSLCSNLQLTPASVNRQYGIKAFQRNLESVLSKAARLSASAPGGSGLPD